MNKTKFRLLISLLLVSSLLCGCLTIEPGNPQNKDDLCLRCFGNTIKAGGYHLDVFLECKIYNKKNDIEKDEEVKMSIDMGGSYAHSIVDMNDKTKENKEKINMYYDVSDSQNPIIYSDQNNSWTYYDKNTKNQLGIINGGEFIALYQAQDLLKNTSMEEEKEYYCLTGNLGDYLKYEEANASGMMSLLKLDESILQKAKDIKVTYLFDKNNYYLQKIKIDNAKLLQDDKSFEFQLIVDYNKYGDVLPKDVEIPNTVKKEARAKV